jgi:hypothetical protein
MFVLVLILVLVNEGTIIFVLVLVHENITGVTSLGYTCPARKNSGLSPFRPQLDGDTVLTMH